jgi:hypothetical protein
LVVVACLCLSVWLVVDIDLCFSSGGLVGVVVTKKNTFENIVHGIAVAVSMMEFLGARS